jgi:hypothetical protein
MTGTNLEKISDYESNFIEKYVADIKKEFEGFKKCKNWRMSNKYGGELIYPIMSVESEKLKYDGICIGTMANPAITSPFKITILSPPGWYPTLIYDVRGFILPFKESLDKKIKDSFTIEIAEGKIIKDEELKGKIRYRLDFKH